MPQLLALADHLALRRDLIVAAWRRAVEADAALTKGYALPRAQLNDQIPALLHGLETQLREPDTDVSHRGDAAAHGLHRWQQGFGLAEVLRELGYLNECVIAELDACAHLDPAPLPETLARARRLWARIFSTAVSASTAQYFKLQQSEAVSHAHELEDALGSLRRLDQRRATLWQQAAHDLRGNLGVVANIAVGLGHHNLDGPVRDDFLRMLDRNMHELHRLLDDITCLARLQGGQELRRLETVDVAALLTEMGENLRVLAAAQGLSLELIGAPGFSVEGDPVKLQRVVQNLVLNAIRCTSTGGVTVSWSEAGRDDPGRWALQVEDTGPGLAPGQALGVALDATTGQVRSVAGHDQGGPSSPGEGIGLSIVRRLCELLDATFQVESGRGGTCFRILLPTQYPPDLPATSANAGTARPNPYPVARPPGA